MSRMFLFAALIASMLVLAGDVQADPAEDNAVKFVEKLGGTVRRDTKVKGKPAIEVFLSKSKITD